jgi:hypothetical protein
MSSGANRSVGLIAVAVTRVVVWITPSHRKEWARAMLNELAYIESSRAAVRWVIGSMLFAVRERTIYQLEKAFMNNRIFKTALVLVVVAVSGVAGMYAIQKPYQRERIKIEVHRMLVARQT